MAIAFDTAIDRQFDAGVSSVTRSFTTSGSDRYLVVTIFLTGVGTDNVTGVTYGGVAMTRALTFTNTAVGQRYYIYTLANPASGANNIVVSLSGATNLYTRAGSYTGAIQSTSTPDSSNSLVSDGTSGNITVSTTTVADNCWLVGLGVGSAADPDAVVSGVIRSGGDSGLEGPSFVDSNGAKTPAGSYSIGWNFPSLGNNQLGVISIAPVPAAGPANLKTYNTNATANIKTMNTNAIANVKTFDTNA